MCGIAGCLVFENSTFDLGDGSLIQSMCEAIAHRGPDGEGIWVSPDRRCGLGHRRLAIIDLSNSAAQPMSSLRGDIQIVFNGEIYNHREIRTELEALGFVEWKTDHSDTEVILRAYEAWGKDCVDRFRGMFAFAIWDSRIQSLWLVRDRIGVKPLYYSIHHGRCTFSSEIKALLRDSDQVREVNEEALYHYLSFLTTPAPDTLFSGIQKIAGGCWLEVSTSGKMQHHRYWEVWNEKTELLECSEKELKERILSELRSSVKYRKESDVPIGVFLSGGVDSSTNAALFSEGEKNPVKVFSIGYDQDYGTYKNELHYARQMADSLRADYAEKILNVTDLLDFLPEMVYLQDEPIADPVCVPVYYVSKLARENGVTVCQVGEGADELFCGYPSWMKSLFVANLHRKTGNSFLKRLSLQVAQTLRRKNPRHREIARRALEGLPIFWGGAEAFFEEEKQFMLSERLQKAFPLGYSWEALKPIYKRFCNSAPVQDSLSWMSYLDLQLRLPELLLMRVDKMSMGVGLETRVPFLDHEFVQLAMSIPSGEKIKNSIPKYLLKESVRGIVPDMLIDRKKQGFGVPVEEWFLGALGEKAEYSLKRFFQETDYFQPERVSTVLNCGGHFRKWYLLNLALWWEQFLL